MSAPDTNVEKQARRHKGPLTGIPLAALLAAVAFVGYLAFTALTGTGEDGPQTNQTVAPAATSD